MESVPQPVVIQKTACMRPGRTAIALQVEDPGRRTRRLDSGYYTRWVEVPAN